MSLSMDILCIGDFFSFQHIRVQVFVITKPNYTTVEPGVDLNLSTMLHVLSDTSLLLPCVHPQQNEGYKKKKP